MVCLNRLRTEGKQLKTFIKNIEQQEEILEQLFQCIFKLFSNETAQGNNLSISGRGLENTNGVLLSQSSMFNSKHNISGLDSVGMSFGKATDDGHNLRLLPQDHQSALKNLNRRYKSDRNVFVR